jgi:hypothetical protein
VAGSTVPTALAGTVTVILLDLPEANH